MLVGIPESVGLPQQHLTARIHIGFCVCFGLDLSRQLGGQPETFYYMRMYVCVCLVCCLSTAAEGIWIRSR